jgi:hypothetical protein
MMTSDMVTWNGDPLHVCARGLAGGNVSVDIKTPKSKVQRRRSTGTHTMTGRGEGGREREKERERPS